MKRRAFQSAIFILQLLIFDLPAWATPTLARLSFRVPPARMAEFESAYRDRLVPILKRHGLVESSSRGRATPDSVFSRLIELRSPAELGAKAGSLQEDAVWVSALRSLGTVFEAARPDGLIPCRFGIYAAPTGPGRTVPAGPGRTVPAGRGRGHWRTYGVTDGLADVGVQAGLQDREGFLWFVTHGGVSRFDGQSWRTYTVRDGLASDVVASIFQDREGALWFGTQNGVSRFDGSVWATFAVRDGLASDVVASIFQDREGALWFGTQNGVSRYDGVVWTAYTVRDGLADNGVTSIFQDREGVLWFGTQNGVSRFDGSVWRTYTVRDGLASNAVTSILQDRKGALWFGTDGGLSRYDGRTFATFTTKDGLASDEVTSIYQDRDGRLWLGTQGGASCYDPSASPGAGFATYTTRDGLSNDHVMSLFQDREGHFWFSTLGGVSQYDDQTFVSFTTESGLGHPVVLSILEDRQGHLWFGTQWGGVTRYDPSAKLGAGGKTHSARSTPSGRSGQAFTTYTTRDGLAHDQVRTIFEDRRGNLWFGTRGGMTRYDGKTFTTYTTRDGLGDNGVWSICEDREGNLWFGTYEHKLSRFDGKIWTTFSAEDGLPDFWIWSVLEDREGGLWCSTQGGGVVRYDGQTFTVLTRQDGLAEDRVFSIFQDRDGFLWFGTEGGGASRYDGGHFTTLTKRDGLGHNVVRSIFQDRQGHFWFATFGGGVSRYDGETVTTLTTGDGLVHNQVAAVLQDRRGDFWFGAESGITRYRQPAPAPPPVSVDAAVADARHEKVSHLAIPSTSDLLAFEFHAISFKTRPGAMVYRYRLKGHDREWRTTTAQRVEYQDLPRGNYTFEVLAVDRDLVYSENPATVTIEVHPPYGRIGLIAALGFAGMVILFQAGRIVQRDRRLRRSNEDLRREMAERTRAEEERAKLDVQLQQMRYLYRLRSVLSTARSPEEVVQRTGEVLMEVLPTSALAGVLIEHDGRVWPFGACHTCEFHRVTPAMSLRGQWSSFNERDVPPPFSSRRRAEALFIATCRESQGGDSVSGSGRPHYGRPLVWGERVRGCLSLCCGIVLSESQERALLDETAGQVARALEARELEMQLLQSARLVSLGQMAAGVAHEINQPLGAISATAEDYYLRLKDGMAVSPEQWGEALKRVLGMVERMSGTVEHLRLFSRDTSQEPGVRLSMSQVIHSAVSVIGAQLKNHGIDLCLDLAEDLPQVMGHPYQIEQVFLNLLGNARDAVDEKTGYRDPGTVIRKNQASSQTGEEGPDHGSRITDHDSRGWEKRVVVRTRRDGEWVVAEVEDNGVGIEEANIGRVFEPFFTTKSVDRGTGLGLSISYAIVKSHDGQIVCESRRGEGTMFRVMLPAADETGGAQDGVS